MARGSSGRTRAGAAPGIERAVPGDDPLPADPTVIFLHIGKTAGTTMRQVLRRNFRSSEVMVIRARGRSREETVERFGELPVEVRARPRLIMGHTVFGLHEHVPRPFTYITILRKPSRLVVSQYRFVLRTPGHRHHELVTSERMTLADYIRSGVSLEMDNSQTRAISGDLAVPYGACTEEMLERAKRNLDTCFAVAGLTERFEETLVLMHERFGWSRLRYVSANVAPQGGTMEMADEPMAMIEDHNRLDNALYDYAAERFQEAIDGYPSFRDDLDRFRLRNAMYRPWGTLTHRYPRTIAAAIGVRRVWSKSGVRDL